ncbi:MAG: Mrp/NBP35 family ATP-binding protein [bacterium]
MPVSEKEILDALKAVKYPELKSDIVTLGFVRDIQIDNTTVRFVIALPDTKYKGRQKLVRDANMAVNALENVESVDIELAKLRIENNRNAPQSGTLDMKSSERLKGVKKIIAVASGKGGVGKSTITANLAAALAADGHKVGILDADIYGPSIPLMMDISETPKAEGNKIIPIEKYGMKMVSMGMFVTAGEALIWRGPMVMKALQQFFDDVDWGELDYLIIDLPPGTGDVQLSMAQQITVSGAVIVTTPQDISFLDVTRAVAMFQRVGVKILGIVENMSFFKCPHCNEETEIFHKGSNYIKAGQLGYPLLAQLPFDTKIPITCDEGKPIVLEDPTSETGTRLINLARKIHEAIQKEK